MYSHNIILKISIILTTIQSYASYQEPGKSNLEWEQTINRHHEWDNIAVGILKQWFQRSTIQMLQEAIINTLETNKKTKNLRKKMWDIKRNK